MIALDLLCPNISKNLLSKQAVFLHKVLKQLKILRILSFFTYQRSQHKRNLTIDKSLNAQCQYVKIPKP